MGQFRATGEDSMQAMEADSMTQSDRVREAYDQDPEHEWQRLTGSAQARLEYLITSHVLESHLPPAPARVLDAGGGPGRYTIDLAQCNYRVTLLDLSPALLRLAQQRIAAAAIPPGHIEGLHQGSITDLSRFPADGYDAVLCLGGPLSHLLDAGARAQALAELRRVARPGAPVFLSVLNRWGAYRSAVQWPKSWEQFFPALPATGQVGIGPQRAPAYFFEPEEFQAALKAAGFEIQQLYGCSGLGAHLDEQHLQDLMADPLRWPQWQALLLATAGQPSISGVSNLLLAVARVP